MDASYQGLFELGLSERHIRECTYSTWFTAGTILAVSSSLFNLNHVSISRSLGSGGYVHPRLDRKVADSYGSNFAGFQQLLHLRPGLVESHVGKVVPSFGPVYGPGVLSDLWEAQIVQPGAGKMERVRLP